MTNFDMNFDNGRGVFRKSYIITENQNKVFDAKLPYWFSLSMTSIMTKLRKHNMQLCALDEGPFNLKMLFQ